MKPQSGHLSSTNEAYQTPQDEYFDSELPPQYSDQQEHLTHSEINSPNYNSEAQEVLNQLKVGWYSYYQPMLVILTALDCLSSTSNLILALGLDNDKGILIPILDLLFSIWKAFQAYLIYQAMTLNNLRLAKRAVKLMRISMIIIALLTTLKFSQGFIGTDVNGRQPSTAEYSCLILIAILFSEGTFYILYYFGATQVLQVLKKASTLISIGISYSRVPNLS